MRSYQREKPDRSQIKLRRGADGRLYSAAADTDIGDIWAEQKRIRLAEAIAEDQRRVEKRKQAKGRLLKHFKKVVSVKGQSHKGASKEVIVNLSLPKIRLPKLSVLAVPEIPKKYLLIWGGICLAVLAVSIFGFSTYAGQKDTNRRQKQSSSKEATSPHLQAKAPDYPTILPKGKSIQDLGGWSRVSPPDKEPVFAYIDSIGGVQINVSQQPLPESFKEDTAGQVAKLAEQFSATEKLTTKDVTVYVGTSIKGPQSVVFVNQTTLILIKSATKLSTQQWIDYIGSLQ